MQNVAAFTFSLIQNRAPNCLPTAEQNAYNSQTAGVTTAIVMAVLVPVGIASACLVWWMVKRVRRGKEGEGEDDYSYDDQR